VGVACQHQMSGFGIGGHLRDPGFEYLLRLQKLIAVAIHRCSQINGQQCLFQSCVQQDTPAFVFGRPAGLPGEPQVIIGVTHRAIDLNESNPSQTGFFLTEFRAVKRCSQDHKLKCQVQLSTERDGNH
jgi:hypothetical protein